MPAILRVELGSVAVTGMLLWYEVCCFNSEIGTINPTPAEEKSNSDIGLPIRIADYNTARFSSAIQTIVLPDIDRHGACRYDRLYRRLFLSATKEIGNLRRSVHVY